MMRPRRAIALAVTALALVTSCGDDDEDAASTGDAPATTDETDAPATTQASEGGEEAHTIDVATSDLGEILTSEGRTLYIFTPDNAGAPTCDDDCAGTWPPVLAEGGAPTAGDGLDASLIGTVPRDDGGEQVTVNGWPVYFHAGDAAPGDTNGQGVGDVWWVVGPDGEPIS